MDTLQENKLMATHVEDARRMLLFKRSLPSL